MKGMFISIYHYLALALSIHKKVEQSCSTFAGSCLSLENCLIHNKTKYTIAGDFRITLLRNLPGHFSRRQARVKEDGGIFFKAMHRIRDTANESRIIY